MIRIRCYRRIDWKMKTLKQAHGFFFLLCLAACYFLAGAQDGFINIDCGLTEASSYKNEANNFTFVADEGYVETGVNMLIDPSILPIQAYNKVYKTVRSFPNSTWSCYHLPATVGRKYVIRASFLYGNYDGLYTPPSFDLYLGADFWETITLTDASHIFTRELFTQAVASVLYVCLKRTGGGTPFISGLELRPFSDYIYPPVNSSTAMTTFRRVDVGGTKITRYPEDPFDRIWGSDYDSYGTPKRTNDSVREFFGTPSVVLQTAVYSPGEIVVSWPGGMESAFFLLLEFADVVPPASGKPRSLTVQLNGQHWGDVNVTYLSSFVFHSINAFSAPNYSVSIRSTNASDEGAVLNAFEIYKALPLYGSPGQGKKHMMVIFVSVAVIIFIGLAFIGGILVWNNKKKQPAYGVEAHRSEAHRSEAHKGEGHSSATNQSQGDNQAFVPPHKGTAMAYTIEPQKAPAKAANETAGRKTTSAAKESGSEASQTVGTVAADRMTGVVTSTARQFTYNDILSITTNFSRVIGKGGSATVYLGHLEEDGRSVAVKRMKESSSLFGNQFLAEVNILMRIHHRNLVSLIGLCTEREEIILVSEYMASGTLFNVLKDRGSELTWSKRLRIAVDVATGLEYLHKGCEPPVIHRDIKPENILLNEHLEAKLADFGLSKTGECSAYQTGAKGTKGYLDPEYGRTQILTNKSDVYSFGVVLFELITGKHATVVIRTGRMRNLIQCFQPNNMDSLLDPALKGNYNNIQSVWKVADLATIATQHSSRKRPEMKEIVNTLEAALSMETSRA